MEYDYYFQSLNQNEGKGKQGFLNRGSERVKEKGIK